MAVERAYTVLRMQPLQHRHHLAMLNVQVQPKLLALLLQVVQTFGNKIGLPRRRIGRLPHTGLPTKKGQRRALGQCLLPRRVIGQPQVTL